MRCKLKSLDTSSTVEFTFKSNETVEELDIASVKMQYLYHDADEVVLWISGHLNKLTCQLVLLWRSVKFVGSRDGGVCLGFRWKADWVSLPPKVTMTVVRADEAVAGDTVGQAKKKLRSRQDCSFRFPFVKRRKIVIDTATKQYVSWDKKKFHRWWNF